MKKMDEIMELLTEEIDGFNRSIEKLEDLYKKQDNTTIKVDSSKIEYYVKDFIGQQQEAMATYERKVGEITQKIKSAMLFPKWLTALFFVVLSITVLTLGYFGYHFIQFEENRKKAFIQGRREAISELRSYFDDHPIIYKDFQRWSRKQDSLPSKK
ncbi:DUF6730 family protein [Muricauda sp. MAR_2010_75]|uniref:DUF6730 family protein n=1 Tax=Allomuricauda sp. MAR_2010_75 TaxID=1250232 RepID=UPI00055D5AAB|nr:DUF6730 family protein [Muricauda sp. MAR_2010_75]